MSETREGLVRTVAGCLIGVLAAVAAWQTGDWRLWLVAFVGAGIIEPREVLRWFGKTT